jgi:hypothetical protein
LAQPANRVPSAPSASQARASPSARPPTSRRLRLLMATSSARPRESSNRLAPDTLVEPDRQATASCVWHASAFAVRRTQLDGERRKVLAAGRRRAEPSMHGIPRFGRRDLQQLGRQAVHTSGNSLGLLGAEYADRRHRPLDDLKLPLELGHRILGRHAPNGSSHRRRHRKASETESAATTSL